MDITGEGEQPGPGDQIRRDMVNASHAVLIPNSPGGEPAQAGVLGVPDAVLDSRVRPVTGFEEASWPVLVLVTKAW